MLQNARVAAFTVSELFRENQQGVKIPPTQIRLKLMFQNFENSSRNNFNWDNDDELCFELV